MAVVRRLFSARPFAVAVAAGLVAAAANESRRSGAVQRAAASCEGEAAPTVNLLQTAASHRTGTSAGATSRNAAMGDLSSAVSESTVVRAASLAASWANPNSGKAVYVVLPVVGFIFALVAIFATVMFERSMPSEAVEKPKDGVVGDCRLPPARPPMNFKTQNRRAEGLLASFAGQDPQHGYRRPALNVRPPPPGATADFGHQQIPPPPPPPPMVDSEGYWQITLPQMPPTQPIGLNLSEDTLEVTGFVDPGHAVANAYGLELGDRIVRINHAPVTGQESLLLQLRQARAQADRRHPVVLTVERGGVAVESLGGPVGGSLGAAAVAAMNPEAWVGTWRYEDDAHTDGHRYRIRRDVDGAMLFEQDLPDGSRVQGRLRQTTEASTMEAGLHLTQSGERHGEIRFRLLGVGKLESRLRPQDAASFGEEVVAKRINRKQPSKGGFCC